MKNLPPTEWRLRPDHKSQEKELIKHGYHPLLSRLMAQRNIIGDEAKVFVAPDYENISHPYAIHDMEKAVDLFLDTAKNHKTVGFITDFDADGVISAAMLTELCRVFDVKCNAFLPSRLLHGYGLSKKSTDAFKDKYANDIPDLLFILDSGSSCYAEIEDLKQWGVKNICVIDHHIINTAKQSTNVNALVNWHLSDIPNEMCTCGLIFQFIRGIRWKTKKVNSISFLTLAAIGTIADCMPIYGDNRIIVKNGLTSYALNSITTAGLHALIGDDVLKKGYITQEDVSYRIAPRINAVGRIHHPDLIYGLMTEADPSMAAKIAKAVIGYNEDRKDIQKKDEAEATTKASEQMTDYGVLVYDETWHIGVAGIVASRLTEAFYKPALVIGRFEGVWRGSGRSVPGVNIKEILDDCKEMFIAYGGHEQACGVTVKDEYIERANQLFNDACKRYYEANSVVLKPFNYYDATLKIGAVTEENANLLIQNMAPYCDEKNPEPTFLLKQVTITDVEVKTMKKYILLKFRVTKDGHKLDQCFSSFQLWLKYGYDLQDAVADVYFRFPQATDFRFELQAVDIVLPA